MTRRTERFHREVGKRWVEDVVGKNLESRNPSGVSISELLKLDMVLKIVWVKKMTVL